MANLILVTRGLHGASISGVQATYETREIRAEIESMLETNEAFNLPGQYQVELMPSSFWGEVAKIKHV